ncbi:MAG: hypothetical protein AAF629_10670 [Chloroflexota bacterium]
MDLRDKIDDSMNGLENLISRIPGYAGYKEREKRREADAILREHLAREFETQWGRINDLKSQMLVGPAMKFLDDIGKSGRKLQTLIDKIKAAAQGYSGFFDAVKVNEDELDALYQFDQDMLDKVDEVSVAIDDIQTALDSEDGIAPAIRTLTRTIDDLITHFDRRKDVVTGLY